MFDTRVTRAAWNEQERCFVTLVFTVELDRLSHDYIPYSLIDIAFRIQDIPIIIQIYVMYLSDFSSTKKMHF